MFRSVMNWYQEWEEEQIRVLEKPSLASGVPAGLRRHCANKVAQLSPIEREQLREFSVKYRGARGLLAVGKLMLLLTAAGVLLHFASPGLSWTAAILMANVMGFVLAGVSTVAWFNYRWLVNRKRKVFVRGLIGGLVGTAVGSAGFGLAEGRSVAEILTRLPNAFFSAGMTIGILVVVMPLLVIGILRNRHYETLTTELQRDAERERLAREMSESQLRLLRAQIEPHFLFNTLGAVQQLAQQGAPRAAELTANLITFLRASLTDMRSETVSLEREFALVEAYLQVMKARLGERLQFTFDLPDTLRSVQVPSMILLTLAENAIKHGIEPSLRGGAVSIGAYRQGAAACIRVHDSGVGMGPAPGSGLGMENVRRRLQLAYGAAAGVTLRDADPGTIADLLIPVEATT